MNDISSGSGRSLSIALYLMAAVVGFSSVAIPEPSGNAENGKKVFVKLGCNRCHGSAGEGMGTAGKEAGPPKIAGTRLSVQEFVQSVRKPKGQMPPFGANQVSDTELADVHAFLQSAGLPPKLELPSSANAENGQRLYTAFGCYECHGYQGQGSVSTGGSRLGPPQIPFSGFVGYVRQPTGQMPPYTGKAVSDSQLADIYAFLQSRPQAAPSKSIPLLNP